MGAPITISLTRKLPTAAAEAWQVVGDFGREHRWARNLAACGRDTDDLRVGTRRHCTLTKPLMGRSSVSEELAAYDERGRSVAYRLDGSAGPFRSAGGSWRIDELPTGCRVTVNGRFEPRTRLVGAFLGPVAKRVTVRAAEESVADLTDHLARS